MTEELTLSKTSVLSPTFPSEPHFKSPNVPLRQNRSIHKRHITHRWCARLAASGLTGADLAVEYLYGKYINNLSGSTINQSGRIILYFLGFLERQSTTIYTLTRQDISAFVQYEQDRELEPTKQFLTTYFCLKRSLDEFLVYFTYCLKVSINASVFKDLRQE